MSFSFLSKIKWLAFAALVIVLAAGLSASFSARAQDNGAVQTYDDAVTPAPTSTPPGMPVSPGEITMKDVLKSHALQKKPDAQIQTPTLSTVPATAAAPVIAPTSRASSANVMLMQGMQSALQEPGKPSALKPPTLHPAGSAFTTTTAPAVATSAPVALPQPAPVNVSVAPMPPGVNYVPGEEPKPLGGDMPQSDASTVSSAPAVTPPPQPIENASPLPAPVGYDENPACKPHVKAWTKTCAEAGYPTEFKGKVSGETRTNCPDGSTQDVWLSNTCAGTNSAALEAPSSAPATSSQASEAPMPLSAPEAESGVISTTGDAQVGPITGDVPALSGPVSASTPMFSPDDQPALSQPMPTVRAISSGSSRADGSCGPANGLAANAAPVPGELCAGGNATDVMGNGPWRWTCKGYHGGMTVSCAAPVAPSAPAPAPAASSGPLSAPESSEEAATSDVPASAPVAAAVSQQAPAAPMPVEDGQCGSSDGVGVDQMPSGNLCAHGSASRVSGNGPWNWACSGMNGGEAVSCTAPIRTDGQCGPANNASADEMPTKDLCNAGLASAITGNGPWNWTCGGMNGGNAVTCSAAPKQDAVCGTATLNGHRQTPHDNLCSVGNASSVTGNGPWNWTCGGSNGGALVSCTASISANGTCGSANGVATSEAPSDELCSHGRATRVVGVGPWTWNCSGTDGGDTQSCTAPLQAAARHSSSHSSSTAPSPHAAPTMAVTTTPHDTCGPAAELAALEAPDKDLCNSGTPSSVSGDGPWTWTCSDDAGHSSSCSTLSPNGELPDATASAAPSSEASSSEAPVPQAAPMAAVAPTTPPAEKTATCGSATDQSSAEAPSSDLCAIGKASAVHGKGPWNWTCAKGKSKVDCSVAKMVDATCGSANGSVQRNVPSTGLCKTGSATEIQGAGPWLWSCVGSGGGASVSCSATSQAQARVDGSCGAAGNSITPVQPSGNLCDSGVASTVYGEGPWTWTCSGLNGGIASTCSAQKNIPTAPPPPGPPVNGLCGASNGVAMNNQPSDDFCTSGTATAVSGNGPWNWNCLGENGGMTVSCTAPLQPPAPIVGSCGNANGMPTLTTPRSGLCSAGISSAVSGKGPWTWSCSGTNGGGAVGCVAPLAGAGGHSGGLPSVTTPSNGEAPAPQAAPSGLVTPRLQSGTLPPLDRNVTPHLQPSHAFDSPPEASALPPEPVPGVDDVPSSAPDLPADMHPVNPPPIRDSLAPSAALKPPAIDAEGAVIPGNRFVLDEDVSSIPFAPKTENVGADMTPKLDKLVGIMRARSNLRVTLTAYAESDKSVSPRDARRLSLTRALVVRDYLTAKGISSSRIDVRALGVNYTSGDGDRVDVTAN